MHHQKWAKFFSYSLQIHNNSTIHSQNKSWQICQSMQSWFQLDSVYRTWRQLIIKVENIIRIYVMQSWICIRITPVFRVTRSSRKHSNMLLKKHLFSNYVKNGCTNSYFCGKCKTFFHDSFMNRKVKRAFMWNINILYQNKSFTQFFQCILFGQKY